MDTFDESVEITATVHAYGESIVRTLEDTSTENITQLVNAYVRNGGSINLDFKPKSEK
tara:strand:+ start:661 stop:834 length:174 start_codon:yes stop_codon:yes gene_type:complete